MLAKGGKVFMFNLHSTNDKGRILLIKTSVIRPNPAQPRLYFDLEGLEELRQSIETCGILNPLSVRKVGGGYELVAGERRLRAARMAGLERVPCIVIEADLRQSSLLALVENLQRRDLGFFEEAAGYKRLIETWGLTQEEAAKRVGKTQSAIANKLRLLRLSPAEMERINEGGLTERHARALLRLENPDDRARALSAILKHGFNVSQSEALIDGILAEKSPEAPQAAQNKTMIKDIRLFLNTVNRAIEAMRQSGLPAECERLEDDEGMTLRIYIPGGDSASAKKRIS